MEGGYGSLDSPSECLATLIMHPGDGTVSEVLCAWLPNQSVLLDGLERMQDLIALEQLQSLLRHPVRHASELRSVSGRSMISLVGEKTTKALASEYAYLSYPTGDAAKLTNVTRVLISSDFFSPLLLHNLGPAFSDRKLFMSFLGLVVLAGGIRLAGSILLPLFKSALEGGKYAIDLPAVLCSLRPGLELSKLGRDEQISLMVKELEKRHVYVNKNPDGTNEAGKTEQYTISVHYGDKRELCKKGMGLEDYYKIVVEEARKLQNEMHRKKGGNGESSLSPASWTMWIHDVQAILRFQGRYKDLFEDGFLNKVTNCDGWMPLCDIRCLLSQHRKATFGEPPSEEELQEVLEKHDHFQRFQVGVCEVMNSSFSGKLCARALYAHCGKEFLYERTLSAYKVVEIPDACPKYAWFPVENKKVIPQIIKHESYRLCGRVFFSVFSSESLSEFDGYRKLTPLDEQYDHKLSGRRPLVFLQFCLQAAVRSGQMKVLEAPPRGGRGAQWKVFPQNNSDPENDTLFVYAYYFTGWVATLECPSVGEDSHAFSLKENFGPKISVNQSLKALEPKQLTPEERQRVFQKDRDVGNDEGRNEDEMDDKRSETSVGMESCSELGPVNVKQVTLDMETVKRQVLDFRESSAWSILICFPKKNADGVVYYNRRNDIKEFSKWIASLDLLYSRHHGGDCRSNNLDDTDCGEEDMDVYEIRRRCKWTPEEIRHIAEELNLTGTLNLRFLQRALTRECECASPEESYEVLELIGDTVLDLMVALDSFLLGGTWNNEVCTQVCRNDVLAHLLPNLVKTKLENCYRDLPNKVKADMVEAIVGAVYLSKKGLDAVRGLLRCLFANLLTNIANNPSGVSEGDLIDVAKGACPYLSDTSGTLEQLYTFNCASLIDEDMAVRYVNCAHQLDCGNQSHYALTSFNRIQDKAFATHFTTGSLYSYRHIISINTPALFNRILSVFGRMLIAFVNEIITEDTHLVIDFDGSDVLQLNILYLIYGWFKDQYSSKSSLLLLNCSGKSVVTGKMKNSYHIHFPQAVIRLSGLQQKMEDLRRWILQRLSHNTLLGDFVGFTDGGPKTPQTVIGQVVFATDYVIHELNILGGRADKRIWEFMDARSIMNLGATCRQCRKSVFSYLAYISTDPITLAKIFEASHEFTFNSKEGREGPYLIVRARWYSKNAPFAANKLFLVPKERATIINKESTEIMNAVVRMDGDKELTVKNFYKDNLTALREECPFTSAFWERVIDSGLTDSKKLRMYLNDKYDTEYEQESRPLFLDRLICPRGEGYQVLRNITVPCSSVASWKKSQGDHMNKDVKCEVAHASLLRLTSLRCPEYRDVHGLLRSAWTDRNNAKETLCAFGDATARDDWLPSFAAYPYSAALDCNSWELWRSGVGELDTGAGKTGALLPLYWTHSPPCAHIGGAVVLGAGGSHSLLDALDPATGGTGMTVLAQILTPSVRVTETTVDSAWFTGHAVNLFPLFRTLRKKPRGNTEEQAQPCPPLRTSC
ncbi:Prim-pol 4 [Trypanosoma melophagium]|uniref:Prim-pol 4 n=1 Tax=Trypanosoma melophagium TaxID=715481 RepID=UPI00351A1B4A|nr:Prim-pol 4 [Trypanosoma melophagium]